MPAHDWTRVDHGAFHDFHQAWLGALRGALNNGVLPPDYYAMIEQHTPDGIPDVLALQTTSSADDQSPRQSSGSQLALLELAPPKVWFSSEVEDDVSVRRRRTIAVRHEADDRVVAMIEVVSPGNKSSRDGIRTFVEKVQNTLDRGVHVLVIDLFPPGPRDTDGLHPVIWSAFLDDGYHQPPERPLSAISYTAGSVKRAFVQPFAVGDLLPEMPLFLRSDAYVPTPLESTYQAAWDGTPRRTKEKLIS